MKGGTLFSGIGAPECAAPGIDWRWAAEIDPFACAVHKARFPGTRNLGDITTVDWHAVEPVDLVVGGPPCQAYSVAGNRGSLDDPRGDLTLQYARILDAIDTAWSVTENVPGWLSTPDNAFRTFLGILVGADAALVPGRGQRWTDAGVVAGPRRTAAWRILDAQHFGVPQRRRRVFVVACRGAGNFACAEALFPLGEGVRRDTAQGRATREDAAAGAGDGAAAGFNNTGQGWWNAADIASGLRDMSAGSGSKEATLIALRSHANAGVMPVIAFQANAGRDFTADEDRSPPLRGADGGSRGGVGIVTHSLRADGFDASEDGTGRGTPLIAVAYGIRSDAARNGTALTPSADAEGRVRLRDPGFNVYEDTAPTLDSAPHAVAFHQNVRSEVRMTDVMGALNTGGGKPGQGYPAIAFDPTARQPEWSLDRPLAVFQYGAENYRKYTAAMSVRRLTPRECARLQGFPDDWCDIQYRDKPAAYGPMYRAYGNSMAVPCIGWVLARVQEAHAATAPEAAA